MRSPWIATACAIVKRSSTVMIFPFERIRSGAGCCARSVAVGTGGSLQQQNHGYRKAADYRRILLYPHQLPTMCGMSFSFSLQVNSRRSRVQQQEHLLRRSGPRLGVSLGIVDRRHHFHRFRSSSAGSVRLRGAPRRRMAFCVSSHAFPLKPDVPSPACRRPTCPSSIPARWD